MTIHPFDEWRGASGIFVLVELRGEVAQQIRDLQLRFDPKLAAYAMPHLTLAGSSGIGPIDPETSVERLREVLVPIARQTPPLDLRFGRPVQFMQTDTVAMPLDAHGPLRDLHERIKTSGLAFARSRHAFTPHVTLNLYRTLTREQLKDLLAVRIADPVRVDHLLVSRTEQPYPPRHLFELTLGGPGGPA
jgi:2'-5' RNA ligase